MHKAGVHVIAESINAVGEAAARLLNNPSDEAARRALIAAADAVRPAVDAALAKDTTK